MLISKSQVHHGEMKQKCLNLGKSCHGHGNGSLFETQEVQRHETQKL